MNSHRSEPAKETGEIPVSINVLAIVYGITLRYLRVKGLFYILIGFSWIIFRSPSRMAGISWLNILDSIGVGCIWTAGGVAAVVTSYMTHERLPRLGYFALILIPVVMGSYFLVSWILYVTPFIEVHGYSRAGITTVSYWAYGASAYLMAQVHSFSSGVTRIKEKERR